MFITFFKEEEEKITMKIFKLFKKYFVFYCSFCFAITLVTDQKHWSPALQGQICAFKMTLITHIINRPGVAGVVLQTPPSLIKSVPDAFSPNLQNIEG